MKPFPNLFRLLTRRRDADDASPPAKTSRAVRAVRWTLYALLVWFGVQLALQTWRLARPASRPPVDALQTTTESLPGANLLQGAWTAGNSSLAVRSAAVSESELARRWEGRGKSVQGEPSELERRLLGWLAEQPGVSETRAPDAVVKTGTLHGVRFRVVLSPGDSPRLRLGQCAWSAGEGKWGCVEISPVGGGAAGKPAASLAPTPLGTPLARRWSPGGELTAEVFAVSSNVRELIGKWRSQGFRIRERNGGSHRDVVTLVRPDGRPLLVFTWKTPSGVSVLILLDPGRESSARSAT